MVNQEVTDDKNWKCAKHLNKLQLLEINFVQLKKKL